MRWTIGLLLTATILVFPALAASDLVRPPCDPAPAAAAPLTTATVFELMLDTVVERGISLLFLGALAVVVAPWVVAGFAVALLALPGKIRERL